MQKIKLFKSTIGNGRTVKFDIDGGAFIFKTGLFEHERVSVSQIKIVGKVEHHDTPEPRWVGVLKGISGITIALLIFLMGFIGRAGFIVGGVIGAILIWHGSIWKGIGVLFLGGFHNILQLLCPYLLWQSLVVSSQLFWNFSTVSMKQNSSVVSKTTEFFMAQQTPAPSQ